MLPFYMKESEIIALYNEAKEASKNAYCPYSGFSVGACVLTTTGETYSGANVENTAYEVTHAERAAISKSIANGHKNIKAIAIYGNVESVPPCGSCRQLIIEFGNNIIVIFKYKGEILQKSISELLPYSFLI